MPEVAVATVVHERGDAIETIAAYLDEFFRHGSSDVRLILDDIPLADWDAIDGTVVQRFPEGRVKVERLCIGVQVEFVPEQPDAPEARARTIPVEAA